MKVLFEKNIMIHFGEVDPQGILYHARVYELAHECLEEFLAGSMLGWDHWFKNPEFAVPLRHSECDFSHSIKAGENFRAALSVQHVGDSSVEFACEFSTLDKKTGAPILCACVKSVHVFVDKKSFSKISVPDQVRQTLS